MGLFGLRSPAASSVQDSTCLSLCSVEFSELFHFLSSVTDTHVVQADLKLTM